MALARGAPTFQRSPCRETKPICSPTLLSVDVISLPRINRECFLLILGCRSPSVCVIRRDRHTRRKERKKKKKNIERGSTSSNRTHPAWANAQLSLTEPSSSLWSPSLSHDYTCAHNVSCQSTFCRYRMSADPSVRSSICRGRGVR